jgi:hypothetical protein
MICSYERLDVGAEGVCDIALVQDHSCALSNDGAVSCWGSNNNCQVSCWESIFVSDACLVLFDLIGQLRVVEGMYL